LISRTSLGRSGPDHRREYQPDDRFGRGLAHQIRLTDPKFTPGLAELAEAVHAAGAKVAIQLNIQAGGVDMEQAPKIAQA